MSEAPFVGALLLPPSKSEGDPYPKVHLKMNSYIPQGHAEVEFEQNIIRRELVDLFAGKRSLFVVILSVHPKIDTEDKTET